MEDKHESLTLSYIEQRAREVIVFYAWEQEAEIKLYLLSWFSLGSQITFEVDGLSLDF